MTQDNHSTPAEGQPSAAETPAPEAKPVEAVSEKQPETFPGEEKIAPMTREEFAAKYGELMARARAVGLRPFQEVTLDLVRRGLAAVDGFLSGLEGKDPRKKG